MSGGASWHSSCLSSSCYLSPLHTVVCTCKTESALISTTLHLLYKRFKTLVLLAPEEKGISVVKYLQKAT